jgi:prophage maintenance system killer protein
LAFPQTTEIEKDVIGWNYEQVEEVHRQTLRLSESVLGKEHPSTLTSTALVLGIQGMYEQVEEIHRQTLGLSETVLGKEHPNTLMSMNSCRRVLTFTE